MVSESRHAKFQHTPKDFYGCIFICSAHTPSSWQLNVAMHLCWPSDHSRMVPSLLPEMHWLPSRFRTSAFTLSVWPFSFINLAQVLGSHTRRTFSVDPLTMTVPAGFI